MFEKGYIKLYKGEATAIAKMRSKEFVYGYELYKQLRSYYAHPVIHNYRSKYQELTSYIGISESTFRRRLAEAIRIGLIYVDGKHLRLMNNNHLKELLGYKDVSTTKKIYKVKSNELKEALDYFALKENKKHQQYLINKAEKDIALANLNSKGLNGRNPKLLAQEKKRVSLVRYGEFEQAKVTKPDFKSSINYSTDFSFLGIATKLNRKSKSTGYRRLQRLKAKGWVADFNNEVELTHESFCKISKENRCRVFKKDGKAFYKLSNGQKFNYNGEFNNEVESKPIISTGYAYYNSIYW